MQWMERALCVPREFDVIDPDWWFAGQGTHERALAMQVCGFCGVRGECLLLALDVADDPRVETVRGVWAGISIWRLTRSDRAAIRRALTSGRSWPVDPAPAIDNVLATGAGFPFHQGCVS